jgi:hypothetical protein
VAAPDAGEQERARFAAELSAQAMAWMDTQWDPVGRLLVAAADYADHAARGPDHMVRESVWYAVGLLARGSAADRVRALETLDRVLSCQLIEPGAVYHGTWLRTPREPRPWSGAVQWRDYDPNWREFIGCALLSILRRFEPALPVALVARIDRALREAATGAHERAVAPDYTNIALQTAYLLSETGHRSSTAPLRRAGEDLARAVRDRWARTETFPEFNSPTYDGVTLLALALWREASSPVLRDLAGPMERALWRQIAARYHPLLRNVSGPYDRAYGMDMGRYVALVGLWIALLTGSSRAPIPAAGPALSEHRHDWCATPYFALLSIDQAAEIADLLTREPGPTPRYIDTLISESPRRTATSWLTANLMIGAEDAGGHARYDQDQYCPFVVHWLARGSGDEVCLLRTAPGSVVDARVEQGGTVRLECRNPGGRAALRFVVHVPGTDHATQVTADRWRLPGLVACVRTDQPVTVGSTESESVLFITYEADRDERLQLEVDFTARDTR